MTKVSDSQNLALMIVGMVTSSLSILGSSLIMYRTAFHNRKTALDNPNKRILFGMSFMDIFQSIATGLSFIPVPSDTPGVPYAFGNVTTCSIQGFFAVLGTGCLLYNAFLSFHYVIKVRYNISDTVERKKVEPIIHIVSLGYPVCLAMVCLFTKQYNFAGNKCWIDSFPYGCNGSKEIQCTRGIGAYAYRMIGIGVPQVISLIAITINIIVLFWIVRSQEKINQQRFVCGISSETRRQSLGGNALVASTETMVVANDQIASLENARREALLMSETTRALAKQGFLYVMAAYVTNVPALVNRSIDQFTGLTGYSGMWISFSFAVLAQLTFPLQGFLNLLVYIRPRLLRIRENDSTISLLKAIRMVILEDQTSIGR